MGVVIAFPKQPVREPFVSKATLSRMIGFSTRWIELRQRDDGLPFHRASNGHARYLPSEVEPFVEDWKRKMRLAS